MGPSIGDDGDGHTMFGIYLVTEDLCPSFRGEFDIACDGDDVFGESVYDDEDGIMSI